MGETRLLGAFLPDNREDKGGSGETVLDHFCSDCGCLGGYARLGPVRRQRERQRAAGRRPRPALDAADQRGSSGGAWIGTANNQFPDDHYVISVESFGFPDQPGVGYGPYLTEDFLSLLEYGENGCQ